MMSISKNIYGPEEFEMALRAIQRRAGDLNVPVRAIRSIAFADALCVVSTVDLGQADKSLDVTVIRPDGYQLIAATNGSGKVAMTVTDRPVPKRFCVKVSYWTADTAVNLEGEGIEGLPQVNHDDEPQIDEESVEKLIVAYRAWLPAR